MQNLLNPLNLLKRLTTRGKVRDPQAQPPASARTQLAFDFGADEAGASRNDDARRTDSRSPESEFRFGVPEATSGSAPRGIAPSDIAPSDIAPSDTAPSGIAPHPEPTARPSRGRAAVRARTGVFFSRLEALGLRGVDALVLMRTRTVMVSLIGRTLRVHEGYAEADEVVLRAIVAFATARTKVARNQARDIILAHDVERAPMPRRVEPAKPGDPALIAQLSAAHQELNAKWFNSELTPIPLRLSGRMATRLGHFDPGSKFTPPEIVMSRKHVVRHGWREAMHTLLHEMVHQWQHETGQPVDHGTVFRKKCREVGITPAARRDVVPLVRRSRQAKPA